MTGVILQPSYIPWRGYFHLIEKADVFVFYDDVQYDTRGWRNRNRIKGQQGSRWLTVPVLTKGARSNRTPINAMRISWDTPWNVKHWNNLVSVYGKAPYFDYYRDLLCRFYDRHDERLADLTIDLTISIARKLGIDDTQFIRSSTLRSKGHKTERLVAIIKEIGADHYISGPSARDYIEPERFEEAGIELEYMVYDYPEYEQLFPPYDPHVSVLDLMFMVGPSAPEYIWQR